MNEINKKDWIKYFMHQSSLKIFENNQLKKSKNKLYEVTSYQAKIKSDATK